MYPHALEGRGLVLGFGSRFRCIILGFQVSRVEGLGLEFVRVRVEG
jgi:hypothetical protein